MFREIGSHGKATIVQNRKNLKIIQETLDINKYILRKLIEIIYLLFLGNFVLY
jgi:hypothetical protein